MRFELRAEVQYPVTAPAVGVRSSPIAIRDGKAQYVLK
jgi:hypothetical protein